MKQWVIRWLVEHVDGLVQDCGNSKVLFQYKDTDQYRNSHYKDKMVSWLSHLYGRNLYTGKVVS